MLAFLGFDSPYAYCLKLPPFTHQKCLGSLKNFPFSKTSLAFTNSSISHTLLLWHRVWEYFIFTNLQGEIFYWIYSIERAYIGKISHLRELNLSGNAIDNLAPKLFQDLKNLLILDLSSNKLDQYLSPAAFSTLPTSLRHLDISSKNFTFLKGAIFSWFQFCGVKDYFLLMWCFSGFLQRIKTLY